MPDRLHLEERDDVVGALGQRIGDPRHPLHAVRGHRLELAQEGVGCTGEIDAVDVVFNVASGVETSLLELARLLIDVMGSDVPIEYGPERSVNKVPRRLADTTLAREDLGFEAAIDLEEGLRRLVDWWRAERTGSAPSALAAAS